MTSNRTDFADELIARIQEGEVEALATLYDQYAGRVYAFLLRAVEPGLAEELLQDVFTQLWHKARQYDPTRGSFSAWFFTLVRHRLYDALPHYQKKRAEQSLSEPTTHQTLGGLIDERLDVEAQVLKMFRAAEIRQALAQLPAEQREILWLSYFAGFSQAEIAQKLGLPLTTIKGRARMGLQRLRQLLVVE